MRATSRRASSTRSKSKHVETECKAVFVVSDDFHQRNRDRVRKLQEHGGSTHIDWTSVQQGYRVVFREGRTVKGGYDYIDIPRALIDWHSHPGSCKSKNICALGVPSPDDMRNVFIGAFSGSLGHLVYAKEGTFTIQLEPSFLRKHRAKYIADENAFKRASDAIRDAFKRVYDRYFNDRSIKYRDYRRLWVDEAKQQGFKVRLFAGDRKPYLKSAFECRFRTLDPSAQIINPPFEASTDSYKS